VRDCSFVKYAGEYGLSKPCKYEALFGIGASRHAVASFAPRQRSKSLRHSCQAYLVDNVLAFDTHTHNFVETPQGILPIDVNVLRQEGNLQASLQEEYRNACPE
jgi:hypothetical protein